jgi:dipeptidyl aminopeptidase/acylaminoacyl peptidase
VSYLVARTDRFQAAVAGAPVANMTSAYGGVRWQSGMSRAFQYERTQSRIGATPWEARELFIENSPLFRIDRVKTPVLILHNDGDGAVPWYQGIELFSALRRLDKEAYLFNYNDQGHGLTDAAALRHWTVHMDEFLDHHLMGAAKPEWMERGVPYAERGTRDITALFGSPPRPPIGPVANPAEGSGG